MTRQFEIVHFDIKQCQEKGWNIEYQDSVKNSDTVNEIIQNLVKHDSLISIIDNFMAISFSLDCQPIQSAWYLELFRYFKVDGFGAKKNREIYNNWFNKENIIAQFNKAIAIDEISQCYSYKSDLKKIVQF